MLAGRDGLSDGGWGLVPVAQTLPAQLATTDAKTFALQAGKAVLTDTVRNRRSRASTTTRRRT
ncbi:MAG: hypothetical protein WDO68_31350 [Gammaproteobacteria bacterium]